MSEELPAILAGVDVLAVLGVEVRDDADVAEVKRGLRRTFLRRAKECHPDKQKDSGKSSDTNLEFARLKAAFDYLQSADVFNTLYNRALHKQRAERARQERSKGMSAKQSAHLEALLRREQEAAAAAAAASRPRPSHEDARSGFHRREEYRAEYSDVFSGEGSSSSRPESKSAGQGTLIVAARTMKIANESEINCLLLSDHFPRMFANFGVLHVEPLDVVPASPGDVNVRVGTVYFESHESALKALLYYRNHRGNFRCDLYALALGQQSSVTRPKDPGGPDDSSLEDLESAVFKRFRQAAAKRRRTVC